MKKLMILALCSGLMFTSCVSKKKFTDLEAKQKKTQDLLNTATVKLNDCLEERSGLRAQNESLKSQVASLNSTNGDLIRQIGDFTDLTKKGAANLEKSLESLQEKDLTIRRLQDALTRKDSVTLALVTSLKKEVGLDDEDIQINVEKGVVFISLSDKVLFRSGSYNITPRASEILAKVAKVINDKPDFEALVEGHTDNVPYRSGVLLDNWDLSAKRSTAIVRELVNLGANPAQLIAAGRSEFVPKVDNSTAENRSINRRTKIYVLPKIDQFYEMIEDSMDELSKEGE
ncbi:OmpA family protein [Rasiella rasia]|uniref:OmpA family protein n=1 Tax=Rasiella rasia TaxID=2744027 RepID=A0A6G6GK54_9FLAO|nr:OmpA family protein [Rasiella rasia]QIE58932.1 OmpA family protein [Rasiella rasia]